MKFYKRMIRPMVDPPALQGMNSAPYPLYEKDFWVEDDYEDILKKSWLDLIKRRDSWDGLLIDEKYEEVELPKLKVMEIKPTDTVCLTFNPDSVDVETAAEYLELYGKVCPKETALVLLPDPNTLDVFDEETAYKFIEVYKEKVDKKYGRL